MGTAYQIHDQNEIYFATFQVVGWADIFTRECYREIITDSFKHCQKTKGLSIHAFVIMSNHVHCILSSKTGNLSNTIRDFKRHTSKEILSLLETATIESRKVWLNMIFKYNARFNKRVERKQFWTHESHYVALTTNDLIETRLNYIHENPVKAGIVLEPHHYIYSSACNYAGEQGLLEIELL